MVQALRRSGRLMTTCRTPLSLLPSRKRELRSTLVMRGRYAFGGWRVKPTRVQSSRAEVRRASDSPLAAAAAAFHRCGCAALLQRWLLVARVSAGLHVVALHR